MNLSIHGFFQVKALAINVDRAQSLVNALAQWRAAKQQERNVFDMNTAMDDNFVNQLYRESLEIDSMQAPQAMQFARVSEHSEPCDTSTGDASVNEQFASPVTPESVSVLLTKPFRENKQQVVVKEEISDLEEVVFQSELQVPCFFWDPLRCGRKRSSGEIKARQSKIAKKRSGGALTCQGYKFVRGIGSSGTIQLLT